MKKLKLNKQTISLLGNEGQKKILGGEALTIDSPCNPGDPTPQSNQKICTNYPTNDKSCHNNITCYIGNSENQEKTHQDLCCRSPW